VNAPAAPSAADAVSALRRRYEDRIAMGKQAKARTYADRAKAALAAGDLPVAATAFRIAANLVPEDTQLEVQAQETRVKADAILCETYTKQARYEEDSGRWGEAARSWGRVCRTSTADAGVHYRAANAILKAGGDLHEAARLAKRASELAPKDAGPRILLAKVFLAAGLELNARRELETAAQLAPQNDTIKAMLRRSKPPS
jgi:tetratricopeptide (TPR) repeat protein